MNIEQEMRAEEIESCMEEYSKLYSKLMKKLREDQMDIVDKLLDLERRLTQLERENGIY